MSDDSGRVQLEKRGKNKGGAARVIYFMISYITHFCHYLSRDQSLVSILLLWLLRICEGIWITS